MHDTYIYIYIITKIKYSKNDMSLNLIKNIKSISLEKL